MECACLRERYGFGIGVMAYQGHWRLAQTLEKTPLNCACGVRLGLIVLSSHQLASEGLAVGDLAT